MRVYDVSCTECGFEGIAILSEYDLLIEKSRIRCPQCNADSSVFQRRMRKTSAERGYTPKRRKTPASGRQRGHWVF